MWTYEQSTGILRAPDGEIEGRGYSGQPPYVNDTTAQFLHGEGPIPHGLYAIDKFFDDPGGKGPIVARLTPDPSNYMSGRSGFMIHGDSLERPGYASDGCIILDRAARIAIKVSGDSVLKVV